MDYLKTIRAIARDALIIFVLALLGTSVVPFAVGFSPANNVAQARLTVGASIFVFIVAGFSISGCRTPRRRWVHLLRVTACVWFASLTFKALLGLSMSAWLLAGVFLLIAMGSGGVISFALKKDPGDTEVPSDAGAPSTQGQQLEGAKAPNNHLPNIYASLDQRGRAFMIDLLLCYVGLLVGGLVLAATDVPAKWAHLSASLPVEQVGYLFPLAIYWLYKPGMECSRLQGTIGKLAYGIKVTSLQGERISFLRANARFIAQALSILPLLLGGLLAGYTPRRQALHDLVARTLVTSRRFTPEEIAAARPATAADDRKGTIRAINALLGLYIIGILGAIAIPAYQDANLRTQVAVGLRDAAAPYQSAVAKAMSSGRDAAAIDDSNLAFGTTDLGQYVQSISVTKAVVVITYGRRANPKLQGRHLRMYPVRDSSGSVTWLCGNAATSSGITSAGNAATDIPQRYLPQNCR